MRRTCTNMILKSLNGDRLSDLSIDAVDANGAAVLGLVTASEDGSYVYFVAEGVLTNGKNGEGREPVAGQPNLYLAHGGSVSFIATLAPRAGGGEFPGFANALGDGYGDEEDWLGEERGVLTMILVLGSIRCGCRGMGRCWCLRRSWV